MMTTAVPPYEKPRAIGYIRGDISGTELTHHTEEVQQRADRLGYNLVCLVKLWPALVPDPISHALAVADGFEAETVFVPDLAHVDNQPAAVCEQCDLITVTPEETWPRANSVQVHGFAPDRGSATLPGRSVEEFISNLPDPHGIKRQRLQHILAGLRRL